MKNSRIEKDKKTENNMIKDIKNIFRLKKEINDTTIKDIRNLFRLKKEYKAIKNRINGDITYLFRLKI